MRDAKAWGNAPGNESTNPAALKARHKLKQKRVIATPKFPVPIPRFQRFSHISILYLGRWPRLLHHAPLALSLKPTDADRAKPVV